VRHAFAVDLARARALQETLRGRVREEPLRGRLRLVAGADASWSRESPWLFAAVVVLALPGLEVVETAGVRARARFPYVPGYLSFRELPAVLAAFERLRAVPDLIVYGGHGRAHPRRFGIASHLGVVLDLPTVGCAKSPLVGSFREPGARRGAHAPLVHEGERIGSALRTREGAKPVFVSVGHRVTLADARRLVLRLAPRFRLPEPIRAAHARVNALRTSAAMLPP
jgi:deoxyribonuclease V